MGYKCIYYDEGKCRMHSDVEATSYCVEGPCSDESCMEWIPVTERLPEWLDYVIVHYENGNVRISMMINEKRFSCEGLYGKVTHWMPLPAPPVTE